VEPGHSIRPQTLRLPELVHEVAVPGSSL